MDEWTEMGDGSTPVDPTATGSAHEGVSDAQVGPVDAMASIGAELVDAAGDVVSGVAEAAVDIGERLARGLSLHGETISDETPSAGSTPNEHLAVTEQALASPTSSEELPASLEEAPVDAPAPLAAAGLEEPGGATGIPDSAEAKQALDDLSAEKQADAALMNNLSNMRHQSAMTTISNI